jgi:hypothetical protein
MGGRRRRSVKKSRKMRGGNFVGFAAGSQTGLGSAGAEYPAVANARADPVTGAALPEIYGGRRRRASRRTGKKVTRKGRKGGRRGRKTMRGGASYLGSANAGYGYAGTGSGGLADAAGYRANVPGTGAGQQVNGVWQTS